MLLPLAHVKKIYLCPDGKEGRIISEGHIYLVPGDAPGGHYIGGGVSLGEHVLYLFTGAYVPVGYIMLLHVGLVFFPFVALSLCDLSLPDILHDLERFLRIKSFADEVDHDVVSRAYAGRYVSCSRKNQILRVASPHIGSVRKPRYPDEVGKLLGLCLLKHPHGVVGTEFRDSESPHIGIPEILRGKFEGLRALKKLHDIFVIKGHVCDTRIRDLLKHPDHGGIDVPKYIKL